jgi:hypothetical protein
LKGLRVLRTIRPLRSVNQLPSLRRAANTLINSLPELGNATVFISFIIMLFAILGLQQFTGVTYYRCRLTQKPLNSTYWPKSPLYTNVCSPNADGEYQCPEGLYCGSPHEYGISLEDDGVYDDPVIQFGICSFDNIAHAILAVVQSLTIEGWTTIMYNVRNFLFINIEYGRLFCWIL